MTSTPSYRKPPKGVDKRAITLDRLWILDHLVDCGGESTFQSLAFYLDLAPGSLGHHLAKLEEEDVIRTDKSFVNKRPVTKATITEKGWRAYNDLDAQMKEWSERNDERRADGRLKRA